MLNEIIPMTRRYPNLRQKVLLRDSKIVQKMISAWDEKHDEQLLLNTYLNECKNLSDERYWELLRTVWILCGKLENIEIFKLLFQSKRPQRHYFSTPEEAKELREMPDSFTIYRACDEDNDGGISWTTSLHYAVKYKQMFDKKRILEATIEKSKVFAYINRNAEFEVIVF